MQSFRYLVLLGHHNIYLTVMQQTQAEKSGLKQQIRNPVPDLPLLQYSFLLLLILRLTGHFLVSRF